MLVIVEENGDVITTNGRAVVSGDQNGKVCCFIWLHAGASLLEGGGHPPPKFKKKRENSGKLRENSVTSGNICGC